MFDAININIDTGKTIIRKISGMCYCLHEISFLMHKNIFVSKNINKWIVHNIDPYILWQIILMKTNDTIFLKIAILFGKPESITAMPSFHGAILSMCIQVDTIYLR